MHLQTNVHFALFYIYFLFSSSFLFLFFLFLFPFPFLPSSLPFFFFFLFDTEFQAVQAGLELAMCLRMTLNTQSSCLHLLNMKHLKTT